MRREFRILGYPDFSFSGLVGRKLLNLQPSEFHLSRKPTEKRGLSTKLVGIAALTRALASANALSTEVVADLRTISAVLNAAVHGQDFKAEEAQSALDLGNSLLSRLEGRD